MKLNESAMKNGEKKSNSYLAIRMTRSGYNYFKGICVCTFLLSTILYLGIAVIMSHLCVFDDTAMLYLRQNRSRLAESNIFRTLFISWIRWDAIYFVDMAVNGSLFEQEWAFSSLWPKIISFLAFRSKDVVLLGIVSCFASIFFHAIACYALYLLTKSIFSNQKMTAYTVIFYCFSPSGIYMSVGYTESLFAAFSFLGLLLFIKKQQYPAAFLWSLATLIRSNGIFWCIFFGMPAIGTLKISLERLQLTFMQVSQLVGYGTKCLIILVPFFYNQYLGFKLFCPGVAWCNKSLPLIYPAVQEKYWNVGFLRYWTLNNIPNFLFALLSIIPILFALFYSISGSTLHSFRSIKSHLVLSALYLYIGCFHMHTQVLNRMSSALPLLYWSMAHATLYAKSRNLKAFGHCILFVWIVYTVIQAGLYGSFLPPA